MATRRESVKLSLIDDFTPGMARAAAATMTLNRELNALSGRELASARASQAFVRDVERVSVVSTKADTSINQLTGRLRLFADAAAVLGPALVPLGGAAVAGIAGLAAQMGVAAVAGGVLIGSMQGLGDALGALHEAHLEPTAENLVKVEAELAKLAPAAAEFAREAYDLLPALRSIRDAGAEGLFPGLTESLDNLERRVPVVTRIFSGVGEALGEIAADSTASFASGRWGDFFRFIEDEAPSAITELASTVGSLTHGMSELWMAFDPVNQDFASWLDGVASGFDNWATGLAQTAGFRDFVDYLRDTGPQVSETVGALANALVQIVQAAAPLGGPVLEGIEAVADVLAAIAGSPAGPVLFSAAAGFALVSRALSGFEAVKGSQLVTTLTGVSTNADGASRGLTGFNKAMLGLAGITVAYVALDELNKKLDETLPGLESLKGQLIDLANVPSGFSAAGLSGEFDSLAESIARISDTSMDTAIADRIGDITGIDSKSLREAEAEIGALDEALASLVSSGNADVAEQALANLADQYGLSSSELDKLMGMLSGYKEALQAEANNADLAADSTRDLGDSMSDAARQTRTFQQALARLNSVLDGRANMRDYEAAIDDFTAAMRKNGNTFDITTKKGRENQGMLDGLVSSTLAVAEGMKGAARQRFLTAAIADLREAGEKFDIPKAETNRLIELLKQANNTNVSPTITADNGRAMGSLQEVDNYLDNLNGKRVTTYVDTVRTVTGPQGAAVFGQMAAGEIVARRMPCSAPTDFFEELPA